jgi:hypothetical protein
MFSLTNQKAKLDAVNPRAELHGNDTKLACDLKISIKVSNDVLSEFHPSLKGCLYTANESAQADLIQEPGHLPSLRFPQMGAIKWDKDFAGYTVVIPYGATGKDDIVLGDCTVDNFKFDCQDGGTVGVSFRVIAHPEEGQMGRLCSMIQGEVEVTLTPPSADEQLQQDLTAASA